MILFDHLSEGKPAVYRMTDVYIYDSVDPIDPIQSGKQIPAVNSLIVDDTLGVGNYKVYVVASVDSAGVSPTYACQLIEIANGGEILRRITNFGDRLFTLFFERDGFLSVPFGKTYMGLHDASINDDPPIPYGFNYGYPTLSFLDLYVPTANDFTTTWFVNTDNDTITLPLRSGYVNDFTVYWGDGTSSQITAYDDVNRTHQYSQAGVYTVTIQGTMQAWYFNDGGDKLKFRSVEQWGNTGFVGNGLDHAFWGCSNAISFGDVIPYYNVTSLVATWWDCQSATSVPDVSALIDVTTLQGTWGRCFSVTSFPAVNVLVNVTTLSGTWLGCISAMSFPAVDALVNVTSLHSTWAGCSLATAFPAVHTLINVTSLESTWMDCSVMLTVPVLMPNSVNLTEVNVAFQNVGSQMEGTVVELWNPALFPNIISFANAFTGAAGLTNYADIPNNWKGL